MPLRETFLVTLDCRLISTKPLGIHANLYTDVIAIEVAWQCVSSNANADALVGTLSVGVGVDADPDAKSRIEYRGMYQNNADWLIRRILGNGFWRTGSQDFKNNPERDCFHNRLWWTYIQMPAKGIPVLAIAGTCA
eukprot:gene14817-biopygen3655